MEDMGTWGSDPAEVHQTAIDVNRPVTAGRVTDLIAGRGNAATLAIGRRTLASCLHVSCSAAVVRRLFSNIGLC